MRQGAWYDRKGVQCDFSKQTGIGVFQLFFKTRRQREGQRGRVGRRSGEEEGEKNKRRKEGQGRRKGRNKEETEKGWVRKGRGEIRKGDAERKGEGEKEGEEERERRKKGRREAVLTAVRTSSLSQCPPLTCLVSLPCLYDCFRC